MKTRTTLAALRGALSISASPVVYAEMASGTYTNTFNGDINLWDISGTYTEDLDGVAVSYTLNMDASGKFTGAGTFDYDDGWGDYLSGDFIVSGSVKSAGSAARVAMTMKVQGAGEVAGDDATFTATLSEKLEIDTGTREMVGTASGRLTVAVPSLGAILQDGQRPLSIRTEAALALGEIPPPAALELLTRAAARTRDETLVESALDGLGNRPFAEMESFFSGYLASESVAIESRVAALEALGDAPGNVAPFLLNYLNDPNPDIRAAAAWALRSADGGEVGSQLAQALKQERNASVRTRIYQALENQHGADPQAVLALIQNESDIAARLAGLEYLAGTIRRSAPPGVQDYFEQTAVPGLKSAALQAGDPQTRLASVLALSRAGTPAALAALGEIARQSGDRSVVQAAQGALSNQVRK